MIKEGSDDVYRIRKKLTNICNTATGAKLRLSTCALRTVKSHVQPLSTELFLFTSVRATQGTIDKDRSIHIYASNRLVLVQPQCAYA